MTDVLDQLLAETSDTGKFASKFVFEEKIEKGFRFKHPLGWIAETTGRSRLMGTEGGRRIFAHEVELTGAPEAPLIRTMLIAGSRRFADLCYYYLLEKENEAPDQKHL